MPVSVSHIGLCVNDLDRALRFYCDGLGFTRGEVHDIGDEFGPTLEVEGQVRLTSQFIEKDGLSIELLHWASPPASGSPSPTRGRLGLTHLSFTVDDVDATAAALVAAGGTVIDSTRTTLGPLDLLFIADPDGTRVELMKLPPA